MRIPEFFTDHVPFLCFLFHNFDSKEHNHTIELNKKITVIIKTANK